MVSNHCHAYDQVGFVPTTEKLEEIKTEHFHIIFQESLRSAVPYIAEQCEEAYHTLTPIFGWYPQERIEVLFLDAFDTHNGWATCIPPQSDNGIRGRGGAGLNHFSAGQLPAKNRVP